MALQTPGAYTYAEWALRNAPDGKVAFLINLLSQYNGMMDDQLIVECQSGNAYEYTQVVKLPTATRRIYNQGVPATLGGVAKQVTTCAEYGDWVKMDASLAKLGGSLNERRAQEVALHVEGLGQLVASDFFYGSKLSDPTQFTGLANIYNTVNTSTSNIAKNVIDCGGTGSDNTSMWLICWGPRTIHGLMPKGSQAGLQHQDFGLLPALDGQSPAQEFPAYRDWIQWNYGLAIEDWRYGVRACNIDVSDLNTGSAANLINTLIKMVHKPPVMPRGVAPVQESDAMPDKIVMGRSAIYVDRTIATFLDLQALNKTNVLLKIEEWDGISVTTVRGIPIRVCDALLDTEARVT